MRRAISIFAAAAFGLAFSATVPQQSASDYYFSRPNLPSNITGRVMGAPPAYSVMRSEDVAWLREAYCERAALLSRQWTGLASNAVLRAEYGKWPLSETNRFYRWTTAAEPTADGGLATNVIVGYNWTTNLGSGVDSATIRAFTFDDAGIGNVLAQPDGWLSTDASIYRSAAADVTVLALTDVTNVWRRATVTNFWTNATCRIEMQMTNGTVSVFTNAWLALAPATNETVVTNVRARTYVDLVFSDGVAGCYTNAAPNGGRWSGTYRAAVVTNLYTWLDGMCRLGDAAVITNRFRFDRYEWYNGDTGTTTNAPSPAGGASFYYTASRIAGRTAGEPAWENVLGEDYYPMPESGQFSFAVGWPTNAILAGGHQRIASARLWAVAQIGYERNASAGSASTPTVYDNFSTNYVAVVLIGSAVVDASGFPIFTAAVNLRAVYESALGAVGLTVPTRGWAPPLVFPVPDPGDRSSESSASTTTSCGFTFVAVVDLEPWTQMPIGGQ